MSDRKLTSKSVMKEIIKLKNNRTRNNEKIYQLTKESSEMSAKLKELEKRYESLHQEELQNKIAMVWLKEQKLTDAQILKFLEINKQIGSKIDSLDVDAVIRAITEEHNKQTGVNFPEKEPELEKGNTNVIFSKESEKQEEKEKEEAKNG